MQILKNPHIDYLRWKWPALGLSALIILAGLATIVTRGIPMGIEFAGGTAVVAAFEQEVPLDPVRDAVNRAFGTGPIRGFAVTLSVGLLSNIFTSTFVSKTLFEVALANRRQVATLSI